MARRPLSTYEKTRGLYCERPYFQSTSHAASVTTEGMKRVIALATAGSIFIPPWGVIGPRFITRDGDLVAPCLALQSISSRAGRLLLEGGRRGAHPWSSWPDTSPSSPSSARPTSRAA